MASRKQIQAHFDDIVDAISEDFGRTDLKAIYDEKANGWRLTCLDANGERKPFGCLGISSTDEIFNNRLTGFWQGVVNYRNYIFDGMRKVNIQVAKLLHPNIKLEQ